jgi:hypothetical protein
MNETRAERLYKALDELGEELANTPRSVRLSIIDGIYVLEGGFGFQPQVLRFDKLPTFIEERLAILKMLNDFQMIPDIGKKVSKDVYHVPMSIRVWESIIPLALPQASSI